VRHPNASNANERADEHILRSDALAALSASDAPPAPEPENAGAGGTFEYADAQSGAPLPLGVWLSAAVIILCVVALTGLGLCSIASAGTRDPARALSETGAMETDADFEVIHYFARQVIFFVVALAGFFAAWLAPLDRPFAQTFAGRLFFSIPLLNRITPLRGFMLRGRGFTWSVYALVCGALAVLLVAGREINGARRWFHVAGIGIQVSDLMKIALVLALAAYLSRARRHLGKAGFPFFQQLAELTARTAHRLWRVLRIISSPARFARWFSGRDPAPRLPPTALWRDFSRGFLVPVLLIAIPCALILAEPDMGTMCLCAGAGMTLFFVAGARLRYFVPVALLGGSAICAAIILWPQKLERVLMFLDPWLYRNGTGQQLWQSVAAFGFGGAGGVGLGRGQQQYYFLSESHTDFILPVIGEELGVWASTGVAAAYLIFFLTVLANLPRIRHCYRFLVCLGALLFIIFQALINMGVVTALLPTKGMALPFVSYGGSNLVAMYVLTGLILSCITERRPPAPPGNGGAA